MTRRAAAAPAGVATIACALAALMAGAGSAGPAADPLATEIARWSAYLKGNASRDPMWTQVKDVSAPLLESAGKALRDGRRLLALRRLAPVRVNLAASEYLERRTSGERRDDAGFEGEWARLGKALRGDLDVPSPAALEGVRPAAVRALGEAALPQVKVYYEASLEYGRNTMPAEGLFYLGAAQAQREFADFCRTLSAAPSGRPPGLRALRGEIDSLRHDLLALYRPPVSIERHHEFILASSTLKEARELDAAGLRHGALLRYLEADLAVAPLRAAQPVPDPGVIVDRLRAFEARLSAGGVDHSLGRLFLESAQADLDDPPAGTGPVVAAAIAADVLPRYFAALEPAREETPGPPPRVTVTLVRWPYT